MGEATAHHTLRETANGGSMPYVIDGTVDVVSEAIESCLSAVRPQPNRATRLAE